MKVKFGEKRTDSSSLRICFVLKRTEATWCRTKTREPPDRIYKLLLLRSVVQFSPRHQSESSAVEVLVVLGESIDGGLDVNVRDVALYGNLA